MLKSSGDAAIWRRLTETEARETDVLFGLGNDVDLRDSRNTL